MAEGIVYLDVDDEITSAASRIRSAPGTKVALVVPYGSRIATSRINFRLLSREALVSNRRLSVIAGDPASRALAASAGLPAFATVPEYEAALAGPRASTDEDVAVRPDRAAGTASVVAAEDAAEVPAAATPATETIRDRPARRARASAAVRSAPASLPPSSPPVPLAAEDTLPMAVPIGREGDSAVMSEVVDAEVQQAIGRGRRRVETPVLVGVAVAALAVLVTGVAAYLFLPSATIALTPRQEAIGPIPLTIAADPTATAVDAANSVIPALRLEVPVESHQTFTTTGRRVSQTTASGSVTFTNYDFTRSNTVPSGSVVATEGGIRFKTDASVFLPAATRLGTTIVPTSRSVGVTAVGPGPQGNVPANAIRVVPQGKDPNSLSVNNPAPTNGGSRTETPEVKKAEVDKALAALQKTLQVNFAAAIAGGAGAPPGAKVFPTTARLGTPAVVPDPRSLVGRAVDTFDLAVTATGSVIAVDPTPVRSIAEATLRDQIGADHRLVDGSVQIDVGDGSVGEDGQVTFQSMARAMRVAVVDADQLRALVKGKTVAEAKVALQPYGDATVTLWPAWVNTVTGVDARLSISIASQASSPGSGASPSAAP